MVGETVIQSTWREHVREAGLLLREAAGLPPFSPESAAFRANAISHLYEAMIEITQALNKLETADDD